MLTRFWEWVGFVDGAEAAKVLLLVALQLFLLAAWALVAVAVLKWAWLTVFGG